MAGILRGAVAGLQERAGRACDLVGTDRDRDVLLPIARAPGPPFRLMIALPAALTGTRTASSRISASARRTSHRPFLTTAPSQPLEPGLTFRHSVSLAQLPQFSRRIAVFSGLLL